MARVNGKNHFVGGWGHELGDAGSAYNLGRAAMRAALSMEDGVGESTLICQFLREKLGLLPNERLFDKIDSVCQNGTTFIASLSTTVFSAAKTGDRAANEILSLEFKELMQEINIARRIYGCKNRVAAAGGVIEHNRELVLPILKKYADEDIEFVFSDLPPVYGACIECCNRLNVELSDGFYRRFKKTYNAY